MLLRDIPTETEVFIDTNIFLNVALKQAKVKTCKDFLKKVNKGEVKGFVSLVVLDEVFFKLLQGEISSRFNIPLRSAVGYVKRNPDSISELSKSWEAMDRILSLNTTVLELPREFGSILDNCREYKLLTRDSLHVTVMKQNNIKNIATNDADFNRVDFLKVWKP